MQTNNPSYRYLTIKYFTEAGIEVVAEAKTRDASGLVDSAAAWRDSSRS